jgi:hypothetical protein
LLPDCPEHSLWYLLYRCNDDCDDNNDGYIEDDGDNDVNDNYNDDDDDGDNDDNMYAYEWPYTRSVLLPDYPEHSLWYLLYRCNNDCDDNNDGYKEDDNNHDVNDNDNDNDNGDNDDNMYAYE